MFSKRPNLDVIRQCSLDPNKIRNVCILAHVDHGKTTIADSLLAMNGYITKRSAGQVRFLDDRADEQERGITMKSSSVCLYYETPENDELVVNLIDTPGHIDFSTEVSAAVRICDGALIVVDLIEGVCVQTRDAIKQAFDERVKMILIINKIDRLIIELNKSTDDIFQSILRVIEDCNAYIAELCQFDVLYGDKEDEHLFNPELGNVIFASALDGWGVTTRQISEIFCNMLQGEDVDSLNHKMWDFNNYISNKKVVPGAIQKEKENLFVQLFLKTIYHVYFTLGVRMERDKLDGILKKLNILNATREMSHNDPKIQVKAILQAWKPLATTIMLQAKNIIPPPSKLDDKRVEHLVDINRYFTNEENSIVAGKMIDNLKNCLEDSEHTTVYVSKMFAVNKKSLSQNKPKIFIPGPRKTKEERELSQNVVNECDVEKTVEVIEAEEGIQDFSVDHEIIGLSRVFSGLLKANQVMYVIYPKYKPPAQNIDIDQFIEANDFIEKIVIKDLYILIGRELILVDSVSVGNICGISGLDQYIMRTGSLSSTPYCTPITERTSLEPIVRNSIETTNPKELPLLRKGLKFLTKIDSCVQVLMQESGELVLLTAGDVHLAKCIQDIETKFAMLSLKVSKPIVSLRETVLCEKKIDFATNTVECSVPEFGLKIIATIVPLPEQIAQVVTANFDLLKLVEDHQAKSGIDIMMQFDKTHESIKSTEKKFINENLVVRLKQQLKTAFNNSDAPWIDLHNNIWSIGKKPDHINLLFNNTKDYLNRNIFYTIDESDPRACLDYCVVNAFDMCCRAGPICEEPLVNCAFIINYYQLTNYEVLKDVDKVQMVANIPVTLKETFRDGFQKQIQRLMEPIFTTDIQVNTRILGRIFIFIYH